MNAIVAENLVKKRGFKSVLRGVNLQVPEGSVYGLLGRNGAGKTTLLQLLVGLLVPDSGKAEVLGHPLAMAGTEAKRPVGYVADPSLLPDAMTVSQLIRFEASVRPTFDGGRIRRFCLDRGLRESQRVKMLSKGVRKRLELELCLAAKTRVMLLDEPFDGLDPVARGEAMRDVIAAASEWGATVMVSSHILSDLERLCDRIGVLANGHLAFESNLDELRETVSLVFRSKGVGAERLPDGIEVIGSRFSAEGETWLVKGLRPEQQTALGASGFQLSRPGLDEMGQELIQCMAQKELFQ